MSVNQKQLQDLLNQIEHLDDDMLFSGLTILAKDVEEYKSETHSLQTKDVQLFQSVFNDSMGEERQYWEEHGNNLFVKLADQQQPHGFASAADAGQPIDLTPLTLSSIHHEYFNIPGKKMFKRFAEKFKVIICEKGGPKDQFSEAVKKAQLPTTVATAILTSSFSLAAFMYPIAIYVGLLIARTGLDVYCEPKKEEEK